MVLPYLRVANKYKKFSANTMSEVLSDGLSLSAQRPCYLEVSNDTDRFFLFFRDGQIYSAGTIDGDQFSETSIRDFLQAATQLKSSSAVCYEVNSKILHSLLILFQKKPSLKLLTSMVDLDEVLDKIEEEGKSCIVSATQDDFLAVLRYEKGEVTALCHELSLPTPKESSFREDFLVKIYTLSAEKPLSINVFEDLLVKYASDAKMIDEDHSGDITELYLSKPPTVTLEFKGKEIGHWLLDRPVFNIGRTADNDIVIDNLAVSRLHAVLEKDKGEYYIRDCDSLNGTVVNNNRVGRAKLQHGDEIIIGKHKLKVQKQSGIDIPAGPSIAPFDQTVIIGPGQAPPQPQPQPRQTHQSGPRLIERTKSGEIVIELNKPSLVLGKDTNADIELDGFLVARQHAEIVQENGDYVIRHLNGYRKVSVGGKVVTECVLSDNDEIKIGKSEFIFQK
jgi:pSer/pThr/pTyr-binding forkhead associated (FHA) protein